MSLAIYNFREDIQANRSVGVLNRFAMVTMVNGTSSSYSLRFSSPHKLQASYSV
jgi:hypothetical protein